VDRIYILHIGDAYRTFAGRPEGKIPLRRPTYRREDSIKLDLRETKGGGVHDSSGSG
jgi:hypothetical protein